MWLQSKKFLKENELSIINSMLFALNTCQNLKYRDVLETALIEFPNLSTRKDLIKALGDAITILQGVVINIEDKEQYAMIDGHISVLRQFLLSSPSLITKE